MSGKNPHYPAHWEADVLLRDGTTAHVRPISPADGPALIEFHDNQSEESTYFRFFAPMPRLSERDVARFTTVDHDDRVALVVLSGEHRIIAVGRYDRGGAGEAEVAFNVSDHMHGKGLGSILLEHLACAARERGITKFTADVLPHNHKMIHVFREAGYEVSESVDDGVMSLSFNIDPTAKSQEVVAAREQRAEASSIGRLVRPQVVALFGMSRRPHSIGTALGRNIRAAGFTGRLVGIHPHVTDIDGIACVPTLGHVDEQVDLAVIAVGADTAVDVVHECAKHGIAGAVVVSAGFAEVGREGLERQQELIRRAHLSGVRIVGPNSFGVINTDPSFKLNASMASQYPRQGNLGLFSQSGALSVAVLGTAHMRGLGISTFASGGNRADVSGNDLMQFWADDSATEVVAMYLESVGNPRKFGRIARRLTGQKPVIVCKSPGWARSQPPGHVVRPSILPQQVYSDMLNQVGVIRVRDVHAMFDVAQLLCTQPLPAGERVAIVSNADSLRALAEQALSGQDIDTSPRSVTTDPSIGASDFNAVLREVLHYNDVDAVVACFVPPLAGGPDQDVEVAVKLPTDSPKPTVACLLGLRGLAHPVDAASPEQARAIAPAYPTPEEAVRALVAAIRYAQGKQRRTDDDAPLPPADHAAAEAVIDAAVGARPIGEVVELSEADITNVLTAYGIDLRNGPPTGDPGVAVTIRAVEDPLMGPVVSFGLAGDPFDILGDVTHRIPPLHTADAMDLITTLRGSCRILAQGTDMTQLVHLLRLVGRLADDRPDIAELRLTPVHVIGSRVHVAAATMTVHRPLVRSDSVTKRQLWTSPVV